MSPEIIVKKRDGTETSFRVHGKVGLLTIGDSDVLQVRKEEVERVARLAKGKCLVSVQPDDWAVNNIRNGILPGKTTTPVVVKVLKGVEQPAWRGEPAGFAEFSETQFGRGLRKLKKDRKKIK